jgi:hypothetical protein
MESEEKKQELAISGKDAIFAFGSYFEELHRELKPHYEDLIDATPFITEPLFDSFEMFKQFVEIGKKEFKSGIKNSSRLTRKELGVSLGVIGLAIYGLVKLIQQIFF